MSRPEPPSWLVSPAGAVFSTGSWAAVESTFPALSPWLEYSAGAPASLSAWEDSSGSAPWGKLSWLPSKPVWPSGRGASTVGSWL